MSRLAVLAFAIVALGGCTSVVSPVRPYAYGVGCEGPSGCQGSPRDLADQRLAQWDKAIDELQGANGTSHALIPAIATTAAYRAARSKSSAATAVLAAVGLYGASQADTFVQLSRLNVYIEAIAAVECAVANYDVAASGIDTRAQLSERLMPSSHEMQLYEIAMLDRFEDQRSRVLGRVDMALMLAVSKITRDVNRALSGSIVSVQSRAYEVAPNPTVSSQAPLAGGVAMTQSGVPLDARPMSTVDDPKVPTAAQKIALEIDRLAVVDPAVIEAVVTEIGKCQFGGPVGVVEARPTAVKISPVPASSGAVKLETDVSSIFIISGGSGEYVATVLSDPKGAIRVELEQSNGVWILKVTPTEDLNQEHYSVVVLDKKTGVSAQLQLKK